MQNHPWGTFLAARAEAIAWLASEGKSDGEIAAELSMSERQVWAVKVQPGTLGFPHPVVIAVDGSTKTELEYLVSLHKQHGAANPQRTIADLVGFVLASVADGSRRPGSWERSMLEMMGLVPDTEVANAYRAGPGAES